MRKANINLKGLRKEIAKKGFPAFKAAAVPRIEKKLQQQVGNLLAAFEEHPVTKEIDAGPGSNNSSGTLGGYGNLFTFIGFERGQDSRERRSAPPLFAPALRSKATTLGPVCLKPHLVLAAALLVRVALAIS